MATRKPAPDAEMAPFTLFLHFPHAFPDVHAIPHTCTRVARASKSNVWLVSYWNRGSWISGCAQVFCSFLRAAGKRMLLRIKR